MSDMVIEFAKKLMGTLTATWRILAITAMVFVVASISAPPLPAQPAPTAQPARQSQILMLGTGTPVIDATRSGTSIGILVRGALYIFDAGPGVERRMLEAVAKGTKIDTIPAVFITHPHSDHTLGLPALVYSDAIARECAGCDVLLHEVYAADIRDAWSRRAILTRTNPHNRHAAP